MVLVLMVRLLKVVVFLLFLVDVDSHLDNPSIDSIYYRVGTIFYHLDSVSSFFPELGLRLQMTVGD
jgi:hypothetical protein